MIRPRTLAITPLITIGAVGTLLVGAALFLRSAPTEEYDDIYYEMPAEHVVTAAEFPRFFDGTFQWDGDSGVQTVGLDVQELSEVNGLIVATGRGTYTAWREADFTFRIEVNPSSHEFTMWESEPSVQSGYVTNGRHVARFDDSLDDVTARWIGDDGDQGTLILHATSQSTRQAHRAAFDQHRFFEPAPDHAIHLAGGVLMDLRYTTTRSNCVQGDGDAVTVHYAGWNEGGVFDNSWERGAPVTFRPNQVIKGWTTALHALCVGDYARVWIPADQAYGPAKNNGRPGGDMIFDIEVLGVTR